jgi:hypothetical protein
MDKKSLLRVKIAVVILQNIVPAAAMQISQPQLAD